MINATCIECQQPFLIHDDELTLTQEFDFPAPARCPQCRFRRRLAFRNERKLYQRTCSATGKALISIHKPDAAYPVYNPEYWWSDQWNALDYGVEFDFSKTFTEQFKALRDKVPQVAFYQTNCTNSAYTCYALNTNDSYMVFGCTNNDHCLYGKFVTSSTDVCDAFSSNGNELCYEVVASRNCYNCKYITFSRNCRDSLFLEECDSVSDSALCVGLQHKQYYILNEFVGQEKFEAFMKQYDPLNPLQAKELRSQLEALKLKQPQRTSHIYSSDSCTGDIIYNSTQCYDCFDIAEAERCRYVAFNPKSKDSIDCTFGAPDGVEHCYQMNSATGDRDCAFGFMVWSSYNVQYSMTCFNSHDLFGCIGLNKKSFCIFNKQYTEAEYHVLKAKIIERMKHTGEFGKYFEPHLSFFAYNESLAADNFPLSAEEAKRLGYNWLEEPVRAPQASETSCVTCQRPFRITDDETQLYKRLRVGKPIQCFQCRHEARLKLRRPYQLWPATCSQCQSTIETNIPPHLQHNVQCEACYLGNK